MIVYFSLPLWSCTPPAAQEPACVVENARTAALLAQPPAGLTGEGMISMRQGVAGARGTVVRSTHGTDAGAPRSREEKRLTFRAPPPPLLTGKGREVVSQ